MTSWPVFSDLGRHEVEQLIMAGHRRRFARGETVFRAGGDRDVVHLLEHGRVAVRMITPGGDQLIVAVLGSGAAFGDLVTTRLGQAPALTITALQSVSTVVVPRSHLDELRHTRPRIDRFLLGSLAAQVDALSVQLMEIVFVPAAKRVLRRLLELGAGSDGVIEMTQDDLAKLSGTTRPTVNEILRRLERDGAIKIGRGRVDLVDRCSLERQLELADA